MSSPLYQAELMRRLGRKDGMLPLLSGNAQPVIVVGEYTHGVANDPDEARAYAGGNTAFHGLQLISNAAGGCIIEGLSLQAGAPILLELFDADHLGGTGTEAPILQCGGVPAGSILSVGTPDPMVDPVQWISGVTIPLRLLIPPGACFVVSAAGALTYAISWKELSALGPT